jgi:hypothetical protein
MSFFRQLLSRNPVPRADGPRVEAAGTETCSEKGCGRSDGIRCPYSDRRGRQCPTTWCPDHYRLHDGLPYCRRHAGVVRALANATSVEQGPDLDNRAPSLADWVANAVDGQVRELLERIRGDRVSLLLVADPMSLLAQGTPRVRSWARTWKLADHTGVVLKLSVTVDEDNDSEVVARVDSEPVGRIVPPWIKMRSDGAVLGQDVDREERRKFERELVSMLEAAAARRQSYVQAAG